MQEKIIKNKIFSLYIACALFYIFYILKQTVLNYGILSSYLTAFVGLVLGLTLISNKAVRGNLIKNKKEITLLFLSIIISIILFQQLWSGVIFLLKIILIISIIAMPMGARNKVIILFADIGFATLVCMGLLIFTGLVDNELNQNLIWKKGSYGFLNPNTAPYFYFASAFVYFFFGREIRFWALMVFIILIWYWLDVWSRTYSAGVLLLAIGVLNNKSELKIHILSKITIFGIVIGSLFYLAISFLLVIGFIGIDFAYIKTLDELLSGRLYYLYKNDIFLTNEGPLLYSIPVDGIYYELITLLGPLMVFKWIKLISQSIINNDKKLKKNIRIYALGVFSLAGLFEGAFAKFSPLVLIIAIIFIDNKNAEKK